MVFGKADIFNGPIGGSGYDKFVRLFGYGPKFFNRAAMALPIRKGMRILDLGCGTGLFTNAVAGRVGAEGFVNGIDIAEKQLAYARKKAADKSNIEFTYLSMDRLCYDKGDYDAVVSCMAFHEVTSTQRRKAVELSAGILEPGGFFGLIDIAKPVNRIKAILAMPLFLIGEYNWDNWNNTFPEMFAKHGMQLETEVYLNTFFRCQVFRKA